MCYNSITFKMDTMYHKYFCKFTIKYLRRLIFLSRNINYLNLKDIDKNVHFINYKD